MIHSHFKCCLCRSEPEACLSTPGRKVIISAHAYEASLLPIGKMEGDRGGEAAAWEPRNRSQLLSRIVADLEEVSSFVDIAADGAEPVACSSPKPGLQAEAPGRMPDEPSAEEGGMGGGGEEALEDVLQVDGGRRVEAVSGMDDLIRRSLCKML